MWTWCPSSILLPNIELESLRTRRTKYFCIEKPFGPQKCSHIQVLHISTTAFSIPLNYMSTFYEFFTKHILHAIVIVNFLKAKKAWQALILARSVTKLSFTITRTTNTLVILLNKGTKYRQSSFTLCYWASNHVSGTALFYFPKNSFEILPIAPSLLLKETTDTSDCQCLPTFFGMGIATVSACLCH